MTNDVKECAFWAPYKTVDKQQPSVLGIIELHQIHTAGNRREMQCVGEEKDENQAPPKYRHRIARECCGHQRLIKELAAINSGEGASRNTQQNCQQSCAE